MFKTVLNDFSTQQIETSLYVCAKWFKKVGCAEGNMQVEPGISDFELAVICSRQE